LILLLEKLLGIWPTSDDHFDMSSSESTPKQYATYPSLANRTVLISGGASGIGAALVEAFYNQGSIVIFLDIDDDAASKLQHSLSPSSPSSRLHYHHCDLTSIPALTATTETILSSHPTISVLINNAASDTRRATPDVTPEFFDAQIAVNLRHFFFLTQQIAPAMIASGQGGSIINFGSINWVVQSVGMPIYTTCKAAVVGLTRTHAHEYGPHGIRVNSIMPGGIATEKQERENWGPDAKPFMIRQQALKFTMMPDHVARLALFLAADDSDGISNQSYRVDGGWT
jgi:D-xylose 1-dehydrogenase